MNKHHYYMKMAIAAAQASKCLRAKYGTVIVSADGRIVSTGYNGKPRGSLNDTICYRLDMPRDAPKENCCLHSEANAIMFSTPLDRKGGTMYISGVPCNDCALLIMQSGIDAAFYLVDGHTYNGPDMCKKYGHHFLLHPIRKEELDEEASS